MSGLVAEAGGEDLPRVEACHIPLYEKVARFHSDPYVTSPITMQGSAVYYDPWSYSYSLFLKPKSPKDRPPAKCHFWMTMLGLGYHRIRHEETVES